MSNDKQNPTVIALDTTSEEKTEEPTPKQSRLTRAKTFLKEHKTPAIAAAGLVSLVGVSAWVGRKSVAVDTNVIILDPTEYETVEFDESTDEVTEAN